MQSFSREPFDDLRAERAYSLEKVAAEGGESHYRARLLSAFFNLPHKVSDRLLQYVREKGISPDERIIPIAYGTTRVIVKKAGEMVDGRLWPHDLRRHAATYASRAGTPLEIVNKVMHSNLQPTQRYLRKVSDVEAMRWIDSIHG